MLRIMIYVISIKLIFSQKINLKRFAVGVVNLHLMKILFCVVFTRALDDVLCVCLIYSVLTLGGTAALIWPDLCIETL